MHAIVRSVAAPPTRAEVLDDLGAALRPFGGWPWGRDLAWASDSRSEFLTAQVLRRDLRRTVLPGLRTLLVEASEAERVRLARGVVGLVRRCRPGLPALGRVADAESLLAGVRRPDACDRLLAWMVIELCPSASAAGDDACCAFYRAVRETLVRADKRDPRSAVSA